LRRFRSVPVREVERFLMVWGHAVADRIASDPIFEALPVPELIRTAPLDPIGWDSLQTIFPFVVYRKMPDGGRLPLCRDETALLHRQMQGADFTPGSFSSAAEIETMRFQLGQPVRCGMRGEIPVSALRICSSARWAAEGASDSQGTSRAVRQAMLAFDKMALLVRQLDRNELHT